MRIAVGYYNVYSCVLMQQQIIILKDYSGVIERKYHCYNYYPHLTTNSCFC